MAIHLDKATIQRLIETQIETAQDSVGPVKLAVLHTGEAPQESSAGEVWVCVTSIAMSRKPRRSRDEEPWADIVVQLAVSCPEATNLESAYAIGSAVEAVSRALECVTLDDSATSGHVINLHQTEDQDERAGGFQQVVEAVITVMGQVKRVSGTSLEERH